MLHHHHLGQELKSKHRKIALLSPMMYHTKCRSSLQARAAIWSLPPWDYHPQARHMIAIPPALVLFQQNTAVTTPLKYTDPGHPSWGPHFAHRLTLLWQRLRYLKLHWEHHLRLAVTEIITTACAPGQDKQHMVPLHLVANTMTTHNTITTIETPPIHYQQVTQPSPHRQHCHKPSWVSKHDAFQKGAMPNGATIARKWVFTRRHLTFVIGMETPLRCPNGENHTQGLLRQRFSLGASTTCSTCPAHPAPRCADMS